MRILVTLEEFKNVQMNRIGRNPPGVDIYFGDRVDTGTRISGAWVQGAQYFDYYFSNGGINIDFQDGWRADGAGLAAIYFRPGAWGTNNFGVENGTINNGAVRGNNGAEIMLDKLRAALPAKRSTCTRITCAMKQTRA